MSNSNRKMRSEFINIGIGTEKDKNKEIYKRYSTRNKEKIKFPNIETYKKFNDIKEKITNETKFENLNKNLYYNSMRTTKKSKNNYTETENDIPKITSKFHTKKYNNFFANSIRKNKSSFKTIYNFNDEDIQNSNLVLSSIKTPELNILNDKNISNINNIYNTNDYFKYSFSHSYNKNNNRRKMIIIRNLRKSESAISLNEEDKNCIMNLLEKKTLININLHKKMNKTKKIRKDEFKEFLKEILKQFKDKNINRVKKKIDINTLLKNKKDNNKIKVKKFDIVGTNTDLTKTKNNNKNDNKFKSIILRNEYLNSKLNNNIGMLTEDVSSKKRSIFNMYKFKKNKKMMNEVEKKLLKLENKIKENYERFKKNINDEPVNFSEV